MRMIIYCSVVLSILFIEIRWFSYCNLLRTDDLKLWCFCKLFVRIKLPSWALFELGRAPVYWKTVNGLPPTSVRIIAHVICWFLLVII